MENDLLKSVTEHTKIFKNGTDAKFTEDGEAFVNLPGDTLVPMNFLGFTPKMLAELAKRFPAFLDNAMRSNPLKNVMLDQKTRKALCVIDLDTVMPGLSLYDFGDSIRFGAASAAEDEPDLSKVEMRLGLFETYTKGFLGACPDLTEPERELLPMGAKLMTLECGVRFLTDYLDGDHYFATHRPGQNLDRARTQFKLVADMEQKWEQMHDIVARIAAQQEKEG